jgi:nucleoside-diphosphate-sugar epimerase
LGRFVVTGAAGFIGSHLTEHLLGRGDEVVAVDAFTDYYDPALKERNAAAFEVTRADLATAELDGLVGGADGVFHLAGQPGVRASWGDDLSLYLDRNITASRRVFEAAARHGVRVVFASSSSVYGDAERYPTPEDTTPSPISPYGVTKLAGEHLAHAYAVAERLDCVTLRYFTVYGPRQRPDMAFTRMLRALAGGEPFPLLGDGSQSRSFTYVADVVEATVAAMTGAPAGAVYNVGGGREATMREAIELAERISGRRLQIDARPAQAGDARRTAADIARIRAELGWQPASEFEAGLAAQWDWVTLTA